VNKLNFQEDLKRHKEEVERKRLEDEAEAERLAEEERLRLEEQREYNRIHKVRNENGSIPLVGGRPPGRKNKETLFKEVMREGFEAVLEREGMKVFMATCQRAVGKPVRDEETGELLKDENGNQLYEGGSDAASKIIMDRIVPIADFDKSTSGKTVVNINVSGLKAEIDVMDGEYEEIDDATQD